MTWRDALDLWHRIDGAVLTGVATYLYLSRRDALRRLRRANAVVRGQEGVIQALIAVARAHGWVVFDPRESEDEPRRMH